MDALIKNLMQHIVQTAMESGPVLHTRLYKISLLVEAAHKILAVDARTASIGLSDRRGLPYFPVGQDAEVAPVGFAAGGSTAELTTMLHEFVGIMQSVADARKCEADAVALRNLAEAAESLPAGSRHDAVIHELATRIEQAVAGLPAPQPPVMPPTDDN